MSTTVGDLREAVWGEDGMKTTAPHAEAPTIHSLVIVDDQIDMRELLELRLSMVPGLQVVGQADNGRSAIQLARKLSPDLMTLDLEMPVMRGTEAIPLLRAVAPHMRIVVFTGNPEPAALTKGPRPDAIVTKGGDLADVVATILGVLARGRTNLHPVGQDARS